MKSTKEIISQSAQLAPVAGAPIRFFNEHTGYIRDQMENEDGVGQKIFRPKCVAIGPRFHGDKDLERGEEIKRLAAWDLWECSDQPFSELYGRVQAVVAVARASYASSMNSFTDEELATMMFVDGCFLLQLMATIKRLDGGVFSASTFDFPSAVTEVGVTAVTTDIFIVENQIPWVVLHALMAIRPVQVLFFIDTCIATSFDKKAARPDRQHECADDYGPIHLLDLLCKRHIGQVPTLTGEQMYAYAQLEVVALTSATELAEAGVCICPS
jgi:hypothetical protein